MRSLLRGCVTLAGIVLLVAIGLVAYAAMRRPAAVVAPAVAASPPGAAPDAAAVEARLSSTEARIQQDANAGRHEPISVTISDAELNALLADELAKSGSQVPVTDAQAASVPGQVLVTGHVKASVLTAPFSLAAQPQVTNGKAQLRVAGISFGGLPVPQAIASQITGAVSSDDLLGNVPLTVTSFRAEQGQVVLTGTT